MRAAAAGALPGRVRRRLSLRRAGFAGILVAMALYSVGPLQTYLAQRDRLAELERQTRVLQEQTRELRGRIRRLHDPGYLERVARECLGMVRPGEIAFIVVGEGGRGATRAC